MTGETMPGHLGVRYDELPTIVGTRLRSPWTSVEATDVTVFDQVTRVPVTDAVSYDDDIVAGFQLLSMLDHLVSPLITVTDGPVVVWNYGIDRVRFIRPVRTGDRFRAVVRVDEVNLKPGGLLLRTDVAAQVEVAEGPAFVAQLLTFWQRPG